VWCGGALQIERLHELPAARLISGE
jgi:hypothetical protein